LLEQEETDLQREMIERWKASKNGQIALDLTDNTRLHRTILSSVAELPEELRCKIARKLLEADTKWNRAVMPRSQSPR
jgi:hypothetical protein